LFVLLRLPYLGQEIFNTDVWKWKARTYDFGEGVFTLNFEKTIQKYHPGVTLMWIGTFAVKVYNGYYKILLGHAPLDGIATIFELHFVQKLFLIIFMAVVLAFGFYVIKKHFGKRFCVIFAMLLGLEPFFYALTRVFHLEGLQSTLMFVSFLWYYHFLQERRTIGKENFLHLAVSAFFAGLALLTKTSAVYMVPFVILLTFLDGFFERKENPPTSVAVELFQILKPLAKWFLVFCLTFVIFWPAMWTKPQKALTELYRGVSSVGVELGHEQLYFNKFTLDPGPLYYCVVFSVRASPVLLIGFLGSIFTLRFYNYKEKKFFLYVFLFSLFYFIQITLPSKKLDRYILPVFVGFILLSSYFYLYLYSKLGKRYGGLVIFSVFLYLASTLVFLQKDYFSYFNPIFGGLRKGIYILEPKWIIGHHEIVRYFEQKSASDSTDSTNSLDANNNSSKLSIAFPEKYYTQIYPFILRINHWPVIESISAQAIKADFFVYPVWEDNSKNETRVHLEYEDSIYLRGVELYRVYANLGASKSN